MDQATFTLSLPADQAMALAQLCKRFGRSHASELSNHYDGGAERNAMIEGVMTLQRALGNAGFAPR